MFATESPIFVLEVTRIDSSAGRCFKCHKFRYCDHQTESENIICKDCVQTLRNQKLITFIAQPKPEKIKVETLPKRTKTPKPPKPEKIKVARIPKPPKLKILKAKEPLSKEKILNYLASSEKALTAKEIIESSQCGHRSTIYKTLGQLVECGDVVASSHKAKNRLFTDKDRVNLLEAKKPIRRREYAQMTRSRILTYIKRENRILEIADVVNATNITKKTVIRVVNFFQETGDLIVIKVSERGNKLHFVPADNDVLVKELMELDERSTANQVRSILESNDRGVSIGDVLVAMGKGRRNGGSYAYIKKLLEQWGCKAYRKGCGLNYYLESENCGL